MERISYTYLGKGRVTFASTLCTEIFKIVDDAKTTQNGRVRKGTEDRKGQNSPKLVSDQA
jgi:hypothetical protein